MATQKNSYGWTTPSTSSQNTEQNQQRAQADSSFQTQMARQFETSQQQLDRSPTTTTTSQRLGTSSSGSDANQDRLRYAQSQMDAFRQQNQLNVPFSSTSPDASLRNYSQPTQSSPNQMTAQGSPSQMTAQTAAYQPNPNDAFYNQPQPNAPYNSPYRSGGYQGGNQSLGAINYGGSGGYNSSTGSFTPNYYQAPPPNQQFSNTQSFATPQAGYNPGQTQASPNPLGNTGIDLYQAYGPQAFANKDLRDMNKSFMENSAIPLLTHNLNQQTQDFNQWANIRDFGQQSINDAFDRQLASNKFGLDAAAFNFSQDQFAAEFPEMIRQFNVNAQLEERQQDLTNQFNMGMLSKEQYEAETERARQEADAQIGMGNLGVNQMNAETDRMVGMGNVGIGQMNAQTNAQQVANNFQISQQANAIEEMRVRGQISNEEAANRIDALRQQSQHQIGMAGVGNTQFANQTDRMVGLGNLGVSQGNLALGNRTLNLLDAFRNRELNQTAALEREQMENQFRMSQLQAYGRAAKPASGWARNWG